jgi:hypothetical protein
VQPLDPKSQTFKPKTPNAEPRQPRPPQVHYRYIIDVPLAVQIALYCVGAYSFIQNGGHGGRPRPIPPLGWGHSGDTPASPHYPTPPDPAAPNHLDPIPTPMSPPCTERLPFLMTDHHILHYTVTVACAIHVHNLIALWRRGAAAA